MNKRLLLRMRNPGQSVVCAIAVWLAVAPASAAAVSEKSAVFEACAARAHGATFPLLHCYSVEMQAADAAMAAAYKAARAGASDGKTRGFLVRSQTVWLDFRDAWCEARVPRSGSLARFKLFECRLAETKQRTAELKAAANGRD